MLKQVVGRSRNGAEAGLAGSEWVVAQLAAAVVRRLSAMVGNAALGGEA
jgi:hypothetical protein